MVLFHEALRNAIRMLTEHPLPNDLRPIFIRDVFGRIRIAVNADRKAINQHEQILSSNYLLGKYGDFSGIKILAREDFYDPDLVFKDPDIVDYREPGMAETIRLLDRQVTGQDWTRSSTQNVVQAAHPPRLVFYGLKGGVGRSTAMALYAYHLGSLGKKVLLIDLDLESPGLSSIMLPNNRLPEFGIVDWFVEDAVGQADGLIGRMTAISPLSEMRGVSGRIDVASAICLEEESYLSKLSRVFVDVPKEKGGVERFHERASRVVSMLEESVEPDIVLIDSRAGLHDIGAVSIVGLADIALLFGNDSSQTWEGYRLLFSHWQSRPKVLSAIRDRLVMVYALFPETSQNDRMKSFIEHSYSLFSSTLYETIPAGENNSGSEAFNFDMNDKDSPHYPLRVPWSQRFQEFSTSLLANGVITDTAISATYGDFFDGVDAAFIGVI